MKLNMMTAGAAAALLTASLATGAVAGVSQEEADTLKTTLTPVGAERAGNADGTIPEWTGGLSDVPSNVQFAVGDHYPNPFASDPIQFTITRDNLDQHKDKMTDTHIALFDYYPTYKMNVYQTRRSCAFPELVYAATYENALNAKLAEGGNGVEGALLGFPFPIPKTGVEVIWNHNLRYRGHKLTRQFSALAPSTGGDFTPIVVRDQVVFTYSDPAVQANADLDNISLKYMQEVVAPARRAGQIILVHETINQVAGSRKAWTYNPGQRRVRRAPTIAYDNPQTYSDGLITSDQFDLYNGSPDRYEWELKGKSERYIAYNSYDFGSKEHSYEDIAKPNHLNQDLLRYELHRVWTVEGTLRPNTRHVYSRRATHVDEDSWTIAAVELYDARGGLWRVQESHIIGYYDVPVCWNGSEISYDLLLNRYSFQGAKNQEPMINFYANELNEDQFTPAAIRQAGTR